MKRNLLVAAAMSAALMGCNEPVAEKKPVELKNSSQRVSYGMGVGLGERIAQEGMDVDADAFALGLKHAVNGADRLMTPEEVMTEMQAFQQQQIEQRKVAQESAATNNKQQGETFLSENKGKEGVVTLDSGLQYSIMTEGTGAKPTATDTVEVHYRGTLIDGTEFDSSYKRNSTVSFPVNGVIAGWTEALQLMSVGSKWNLYIPSDLAYGSGGTGGSIGPNATLIFEVELVDIKGGKADAAES
ncbi:MAG: FKBP-type peptidyl-prolyl cis-trans isomerase [Pseudohongiellaceae bacterium]|jgi:FKBP-type peptidyl-prolyl cis-trans isomerase